MAPAAPPTSGPAARGPHRSYAGERSAGRQPGPGRPQKPPCCPQSSATISSSVDGRATSVPRPELPASPEGRAPHPPATPLGVAGSPPMRRVVPRDVAGAVAARCGAPVEDSRAGAEPWRGPQRGTLCTQARGTRLPPGVSQTAEPIPARTPPPGPAGPPVSPGGQTVRLQGRWHSVPPAGFRLDQKVPEQTRPLTLSSSAWKGKLET